MTPTLLTLTSAFLLVTLFSGCASKASAPLACFKGSPSCYSQDNLPQETCLTCRATLI